MALPARQRILDAAVALIRERGVARVTTKEIAAAASAAEGSLFKNFGDKMGLLTAVLAEELPEARAWRAAAKAPGQGELAAMLTDASDRATDFYLATLPLIAVYLADTELLERERQINSERATSGPQIAIDITAHTLREWQAAGYLGADADTNAIAISLCGAAFIQAYVELIGTPTGPQDTRAQRLDAVVRTVLAGAQPPRRADGVLPQDPR